KEAAATLNARALLDNGQVQTAKPYKHPGHFDWAFFFDFVTANPVGKVVRVIFYTTDPNNPIDVAHFCCLPMEKMPGKAKIGYGYPDITISYPPPPAPDPAHLPADFTTYGLAGDFDPNSKKAWLAPVGQGKSVAGDAVQPPDNFKWAFHFTGIANGTYMLSVQLSTPNLSSTNTAQQTLIVP